MKQILKNCRAIVVAGALLALTAWATAPAPAHDVAAATFPPNARPYGKTYGQWGAAWWQWVAGIPAETNPLFDETGEFGHIDQSGPVWFLAGTFGGTAERSLTVPAGKALFFPILNAVLWAPDDLEFAAAVAEYLGLDPEQMTDEELIRVVANFAVGPEISLSLILDGKQIGNLEKYRADSPAFQFLDTDLWDDLGIPVSQPNLAVTAGYWIMIPPLSAGKHELHFAGWQNNPLFGEFSLDVTYHLTVE